MLSETGLGVRMLRLTWGTTEAVMSAANAKARLKARFVTLDLSLEAPLVRFMEYDWVRATDFCYRELISSSLKRTLPTCGLAM